VRKVFLASIKSGIARRESIQHNCRASKLSVLDTFLSSSGIALNAKPFDEKRREDGLKILFMPHEPV
jgi:hypothetical protein